MKSEWTGFLELLGRKLKNANYHEISRKMTYILRAKKDPMPKNFSSAFKIEKIEICG
jgi:hypothetical protein